MFACRQVDSNISFKEIDLESLRIINWGVGNTDWRQHKASKDTRAYTRSVRERASLERVCCILSGLKVTWLFQTVSWVVFVSLSLIHNGQGSGVQQIRVH